MLCPEVWNLKVTNNSIVVKSGVYDAKNKQFVENILRNHNFNQMVSLVLPNCSGSTPEDIIKLLKDTDYYRVDNFDLQEFLNREFIEGFIKKGKFTALSWNARNDIDDCIAVTPDGKLILSIDKELYQSLGIEGQKSVSNNFKNIVKIDLKHPDVRTGKSFFDRITRALSNDAFTTVSLQFSWEPPDSSICPSSIAKYFNDKNYAVKLCQAKIKIHTERLWKSPKFSPGNVTDTDRPHELVEYVAMRMLSCDMEKNEILSSYSDNEDVDDIDSCKIVHCKGFFPALFIYQLMNVLRRQTPEPWLGFCLNGFEYSPLTFFNREHTITTNGDNDIFLLFYPDNKFLFYQNSSSNKRQY